MNNINTKETLMMKKSHPLQSFIYALIYTISIAVVALVIFFIIYILAKGIPVVKTSFLFSAENPVLGTIGIFPSIINTLYIVFFTLLISIPLGVGGAIYLTEYAKKGRLTTIIEFATETLAGIPSILYGVFGYIFFCVILGLGVSLLAGVCTLTIMVLPIMIRTTEEALRTVPVGYKNGALALGSGKWHLIRTILIPCSFKGILTGIILSCGRMVSESAALLLCAGGSAMYMPRGNVFEQLTHSGSTLSVELYRYAMSRGDNASAFGIATVLLIIVASLNLLARGLAWKLKND